MNRLGSGAFGLVCLVRYRVTGKYYALKTMSKRLVLQKRQVGRGRQLQSRWIVPTAAVSQHHVYRQVVHVRNEVRHGLQLQSLWIIPTAVVS